MKIKFHKYQGTGNDFVMIDGRQTKLTFTSSQIEKICNRRFGIGADGVIVLRNHAEADFEMDYFNADGTKSFCGNGSRCAQAFARDLGIIKNTSHFLAIDGFHEGRGVEDGFATKMGSVNKVEKMGEDYFIHTGSPHYIKYVADVDLIDVAVAGKVIRNNERFYKEGTNVNFVSKDGSTLKVRTYERGVEGETFSCGTGVTAVAISYLHKENISFKKVPIITRGGSLKIELNKLSEQEYEDIWLVGPAEKTFEGEFEL